MSGNNRFLFSSSMAVYSQLNLTNTWSDKLWIVWGSSSISGNRSVQDRVSIRSGDWDSASSWTCQKHVFQRVAFCSECAFCSYVCKAHLLREGISIRLSLILKSHPGCATNCTEYSTQVILSPSLQIASFPNSYTGTFQLCLWINIVMLQRHQLAR